MDTENWSVNLAMANNKTDTSIDVDKKHVSPSLSMWSLFHEHVSATIPFHRNLSIGFMESMEHYLCIAARKSLFQREDRKSFECYLKRDVDMDAKDEDGHTTLHCAAESGHADVIETLVNKGADAEARNNKDVTALQIAESLHYVGITRILIHRGATKDNNNMT
ncbi:uncharacterized protein [Pyrus communis]|uniref:uncharacterized protein n=1 Tax=Pyrus communis TaxID=23211 RepID=UPI0035C1E211